MPDSWAMEVPDCENVAPEDGGTATNCVELVAAEEGALVEGGWDSGLGAVSDLVDRELVRRLLSPLDKRPLSVIERRFLVDAALSLSPLGGGTRLRSISKMKNKMSIK